MRRTTALLTAVLLAAGCLGSQPEDGDGGEGTGTPAPVSPDWAERALPFGQDHHHNDPAQHEGLSTPNFEVLGWDPMTNEYHKATAGGHYCGDVGKNAKGRYAVVHSFTSDVALVVMDITDAARPVKLGELVLPRTHVYDSAMMPDASIAVLATSPLDTGPDAAPLATYTVRAAWRDACGNTYEGPESEVPYASGVVLVDLSDLKSPRVVDYVAQPAFGAHSVFATMIDGTRYVLASTTNLVHQASYFTILTVQDLPGAGPRFQPYASYDSQYPDPSGGTPLDNGHVDGWIQKHPITNQVLAYLANWNGGLIILRLDGPGRAIAIGFWNDYDESKGSEMTGQIHDALPIEGTWEGKHYTFIGQEIVAHPANRPTGQVIRLDTTDPTRPKPTARWTLPVDVTWSQSLIFSTHYIELVERTLLVSMYHGGVWAVDADPSQGSELPTLGVFIPDRVPPTLRKAAEADPAPEVLDVLAQDDGSFVSFDARGGLYVMRFHPETKMPPIEPWTQDSWIK